MSEFFQQSRMGADTAPAMGRPDLSDCDREPIHIPGAIQPHGVLLAVNPVDLRVVRVAGDTERYLGTPIQALLDSSLTAWLAAEHVARLRDMTDSVNPTTRPAHAFNLRPADEPQTLEVTAHQSSGLLILEIEQNDDPDTVDFLTVVQAMIRKIQPAASVEASLKLIVESVREVSGFDRVMVYRFLSDGTGVVEAEARRTDLSPYLGLHYPASDIPKQARDLYLRNWLRLIPDVHYKPAPLKAATSAADTPIDLSYSMLRSVSPIHLEYLTNMGVAASMSLSIIMGGKLWGLIACHHQQPRYLPHRLRVALELFSQMTSFLLETKIAGEELSYRLQRKTIHEALISRLTAESDLAKELTQSHPNLIDYVPSSGVGVWLDDRFLALGETPDRADVVQLVAWLNETVADGIFETNCLSSVYQPATAFADTASGLLALSISKTPRDYVLWFRPEFVREVTWAGNPDDKSVTVQDDELRLSPRKSFALWKSQVRLQSKPWENADIQTAQALRVSLLEVVLKRIDQVAREREKARIKQEELMAELDRRMKQWEATAEELRREGDRRAVVETELSMVLRRTVLEQEAERRRIARELHDSLGQYLAVMQLDLDSIGRHAEASGEIQQRVLKLKQLTASVGHEVNRLAWEIRPTALDDLGLQTAVQQFLEEWSETSKLKFDLHLTLSDRRLPPVIETALYRTLQEAVTNVVKHADATKVGIILEGNENEARLIIEDNGRGFHWGDVEISPAPTVRLGLLGIRERLSLVGGTLEVETAPGQGTTLIIHVPV
jgi:light-regulated signal transduction histidine kinase (bacteriophytochrome)